jgi:hypothetical protein
LLLDLLVATFVLLILNGVPFRAEIIPIEPDTDNTGEGKFYKVLPTPFVQSQSIFICMPSKQGLLYAAQVGKFVLYGISGKNI